MNKAIFFDRDGVLIKPVLKKNRPFSIKKIKDLKFIIDDQKHLNALKNKGYRLIMVTNQPDVARNEISQKFVNEVNLTIVKKLGLDGSYVCLHDDVDKCLCRKPKNGLLLKAAKDFDLNLKKCFLIGDRWKDITAAEVSGCRSIFIDYNYDEKKPKRCTFNVTSTLAAIEIILSNYE